MGMELEEIAEAHPEWYESLVEDPFLTRFPGGECYGDLTSRLEQIVVDMEQQVGPVLVVSHVSVLQALVSYFRNSKIEQCTSIEIPLNTVLKFTPAKGGGWAESLHRVIPSPSPSQTDLCNSSNGSSHVDLCALSPELKNPRNTWNGPKILPPIWGDHLCVPSFAPLRRHNSLNGQSSPAPSPSSELIRQGSN